MSKRKKIYICSLSFPILGGRDSTRALQSTPFQNPVVVDAAYRGQYKEGFQDCPRVKLLTLNYKYIFTIFKFKCSFLQTFKKGVKQNGHTVCPGYCSLCCPNRSRHMALEASHACASILLL